MARLRNTQKKVSKDNAKQTIGWKIFDWSVVITFVILTMLGTLSALIKPSGNDKYGPKMKTPDSSLIIQVYNGSGNMAMATIVTDSLRNRGVDVQNLVKSSKKTYPFTILLDRKHQKSKIDSLVSIMGLPADRVILQRNNEFFDATLVLGVDYKTAIPNLLYKTSK